jgi:2-polyprenyl-3-methyl-5-hydroxy-6-metoxy-1,4-benzoquinol methylase
MKTFSPITQQWSFQDRLKHINEFDGNLILGAKDFPRKTLRSGSSRPASGDMIPEHERVVEKIGRSEYSRRHGMWEPVENCPVCRSAKRTDFIERMGLVIVQCEECLHRYLNPRVKFDVAVDIYKSDRTASDIYTSEVQIAIDKKKYKYGLDLLDLVLKDQRRKILDIGCGAGVFLEVALSSGWKKCVGVDINEGYRERYDETEGIHYVMCPFEYIAPEKLGNEYDAITMWSVLEHIYDQHDILERVRSLLSDDGYLFILVPNVDSLATRIIRSGSPTFAWKHVSYFNAASLDRLLTDCGFECVHMETIISEIDNIKSYMSGHNPYSGIGDQDGIFDWITPKYIHENLLGSRLIAIFKKS